MAGNMFSTKGRYALRAMADLATHDGWVSLGDVSKRQGISRKYLEQVIALMQESLRTTRSARSCVQPKARLPLSPALTAAQEISAAI